MSEGILGINPNRLDKAVIKTIPFNEGDMIMENSMSLGECERLMLITFNITREIYFLVKNWGIGRGRGHFSFWVYEALVV